MIDDQWILTDEASQQIFYFQQLSKTLLLHNYRCRVYITVLL